MNKYVEITYPRGEPTAAKVREFKDGDNNVQWVVGHANTVNILRTQYECVIVPLVAMTPELIDALDTVLTNCEVDMEMEAFDGDYAVQMAAAIKLLRRLMDEETTADAPPVG